MPKDTTKATAARWKNTTAEQRSEHARRIRTDLTAHVRAVVDRAPELTPEQVARIRAALASLPL